jgi:hypothetical protein
MTAKAPQAGWFPDPSGGPERRYFNGSEWTDYRKPAHSGNRQAKAVSPEKKVLLIAGLVYAAAHTTSGSAATQRSDRR